MLWTMKKRDHFGPGLGPPWCSKSWHFKTCKLGQRRSQVLWTQVLKSSPFLHLKTWDPVLLSKKVVYASFSGEGSGGLDADEVVGGMRIALLFQLYFAFAVGFGEKAELGALVTLGCLKNSIALLVSLRKPWRRRFNALLCHFSKVCSTYIQYLLRNDNKFNAQNGWKWNINIWQTT